MAYIHPADLIKPYLEPLVTSAGRGITQGVQLANLGGDIAKLRMMRPYYEAETQQKIQEIADKRAKEARFQALVNKFKQPSQTETMIPPGTRIPEIAAAGRMTTRTMPPQYTSEDMLTLEMLGFTNLLPKKTVNEPTGQEITSGLLTSPSAGPISGYTVPQNYHLVPAMVNGVPTEAPMMFDARGNLTPIAGQPGAPKAGLTAIPGAGGRPVYGLPVPGGTVYERPYQTTGGAGGDGVAKTGMINLVNKELLNRWFAIAANNPGVTDAVTQGWVTTDQFGSTINEGRMYKALTKEQKEWYNWEKIQAQANAATMSPAQAVQSATNARAKMFPVSAEPGKPNLQTGVDFLKSAKSRSEAVNRIKQLKARGWTKEQCNEIVKQTGWE